ncbi:unnamed protein product, partial [marine sediment metagenome]
MPKLFDLSDALWDLRGMAEDNELPEDDWLSAVKESLEGEFEETVFYLAGLQKQLEADAGCLEEVRKAYEIRERSIKNRAKRLKNYLRDAIIELGPDKKGKFQAFENDLHKVTVQRNGAASVDEERCDVNELPRSLTKTTIVPDKTRIIE